MPILAAIAAGRSFTCTPTRVWDGDGPIWCAEGPRIRLAGIAAREIDGRCRRRQPCPEVSGRAARDRLVEALGGQRGRSKEGHILVAAAPLRCRSAGAERYGRTAAWCQTEGGLDLSCHQVLAGVAMRWRRFGGAQVCRG